ncbi:MAG: DUF3050 domain-containing protein [Candidatus Margulisbacteria bacterium]|nr:DUF3050 domain-containing protein [Candidatus Margulisiibacteriota bacterium]
MDRIGHTVLMTKIDRIKVSLESLHQQLRTHRLYAAIKTLDDLIIFMSHHVFSVWDFMNLLKTLQSQITCTTIPWKPVLYPENARLINAIVLEEESDVIDGKVTSHFGFYLSALNALQPDNGIKEFLVHLDLGNSYSDLIALPYVPTGARPFLETTYKIIQGPLIGVASAFTYGRESIIPTLFQQIVNQAEVIQNPQLKKFVDYLERHIELDGDVHSKLAEQMVENLCQTEDDLLIAIETAKEALEARIALWDQILLQIEARLI